MNDFTDRYLDTLRRVGDFKGRTDVTTFNAYIWPNSFVLLAAFIGAISISSTAWSDRLVIVVIAVAVALLIPEIAASVRRLHDRGRPGSYLALIVVPIVNLWLIWELFQPGDDDPNEYGPPAV